MQKIDWYCKRGHAGTEYLETEVEAEVRAAYIRMGVCSVCGADGLGVRFSEGVPEAPATEPEVSKKKK